MKTLNSTLFQYETRGVARTLTGKKKLNVTFGGTTAYAREGMVNIPALPMGADMTKEQVAVFRGYVDHEDGHHIYTDMDIVERTHVMDQEVRGWLNALEDARIEALKHRDFPGAKANLTALNEKLARRVIDDKACQDVITSPDGLSYAVSMAGAVLGGVGSKNCEAVLDMLSSKTRAQAMEYARQAIACKDTAAALKLAESIVGKLHDPEPEPDTSPDEGDDSGSSCSGGASEDDEPSDNEGDEAGGDDEAGEGASGEAGEGEEGDEEGDETIPGKGGDDSEGGDEADLSGKGKGGHEGDDPEGDGEGGDTSGDPSPAQPTGKAGGSDRSATSLTKDAAIKEVVCEEAKALGEIEDDGSLQYYYVGYSGDDRIVGRNSKQPNAQAELRVMRQDKRQDFTWQDYLQRTAGKSSVISRRLERVLASHEERKWDGGHESGRIDRRRLVQAAQGKPNVFMRRGENEDISTAVTILIDLSGSMGFGPKSRRFVAHDVAILMTQAIERIGAAIEVLGFSNTQSDVADHDALDRSRSFAMQERKKAFVPGTYRGTMYRSSPLALYVFKDFETPVNRAHNELLSINEMGGGDNSDGEFVELATDRILRRPEHRKVLIVLSDGQPACESLDMNALRSHLKRAVNRAESLGVETVGIGIQSSAVSLYYPKYVICRDLEHFVNVAFNEVALVLSGKKIDLAKTA